MPGSSDTKSFEKSASKSAKLGPPLKTPLLLLVDDDEDQRLVYKTLFEREDCDVITAASAAEACELVEQVHVDIVVSDVNMPGISGRELVERLRNSRDQSSIPIVSFSADTATGDSELLACGADAHYSKSDTRGLLSGINELLEQNKQNTSLLGQIQGRFD